MRLAIVRSHYLWTGFICLLAAIFVLTPGLSQAQLVQVSFSGFIDEDPSGVLGGDLSYSGTIVYDPSVAPIRITTSDGCCPDPSRPTTTAVYDVVSFELMIGGTSVSGESPQVSITDSTSPTSDGVSFRVSSPSLTLGGVTFTGLTPRLGSFGLNTAFSDIDLNGVADVYLTTLFNQDFELFGTGLQDADEAGINGTEVTFSTADSGTGVLIADGDEVIADFDLTELLPTGAVYTNIEFGATFDPSDPVEVGLENIETLVFGDSGGMDLIQVRGDALSGFGYNADGTEYGPLTTANPIFDPMLDGIFSLGLRASSGSTRVRSIFVRGQGRLESGEFFRTERVEVFFGTRGSEPPVAMAGADQSARVGETVLLDGTGSFDDNTPTDSLLFNWSITSQPVGSTTILAGSDSAMPSLSIDVAGFYTVELVVTDLDGQVSEPDTLLISSNNLAPTANAGPDQLTYLNSTVVLDGSGSFDPEGDSIMYDWLVTSPSGVELSLAGVQPSFTVVEEGNYSATLTVSDFLGPGQADMAVLTVAAADDFAQIGVLQANGIVTTLDATEVTTAGNQNALTNFFAQAIRSIQKGNIADAIDKLENALSRTDGCAERGLPDEGDDENERDWIVSCGAQATIYSEISSALTALRSL